MKKYQIQEGDTLVTVAKKFGVRVLALIEANNLQKVTYLTPGEYILIPVEKKKLLDFYVVQEGETLRDLSDRFETSSEVIRKLNGLRGESYLYEGEKLLVPKKDTAVYFAEEGDSIRSVADFFGTTADELLKVNPHLYLMREQMVLYYK